MTIDLKVVTLGGVAGGAKGLLSVSLARADDGPVDLRLRSDSGCGPTPSRSDEVLVSVRGGDLGELYRALGAVLTARERGQ